MQCLRQLYNRPGCEPLVLDAHVLSSKALVDQEGLGTAPAAATHCLSDC